MWMAISVCAAAQTSILPQAWTATDQWPVNTLAAEVLYAGPAPFQVGGLYQVNVRVPSGTNGACAIVIQLPNLGGSFTVGASIFVTPIPPTTGEP
jgi:uncharacterized protein (TIGR03437 family)